MNRWLSPELAHLAKDGTNTVPQILSINESGPTRGVEQRRRSATPIEALFSESLSSHASTNRLDGRRLACLRAAAFALLCASAAFSYVAWSHGVGSASAITPWKLWSAPAAPSSTPENSPAQSPEPVTLATPELTPELKPPSADLRAAMLQLRKENHALLERLASLEHDEGLEHDQELERAL